MVVIVSVKTIAFYQGRYLWLQITQTGLNGNNLLVYVTKNRVNRLKYVFNQGSNSICLALPITKYELHGNKAKILYDLSSIKHLLRPFLQSLTLISLIQVTHFFLNHYGQIKLWQCMNYANRLSPDRVYQICDKSHLNTPVAVQGIGGDTGVLNNISG